MSRLFIDVGSTYFKIKDENEITQYFRNFDRDITDDLKEKCGDTIAKYAPEDIYICSSANGGLSTLIIGLTRSFSIKYATNIAYNSGINIIDTVLYPMLKTYPIPTEPIDVVIITGGIDDVEALFGEDILHYLERLNYANIVYAGSAANAPFFEKNIAELTSLPNIVDDKLHVRAEALTDYLTNLYQEDIIGKEDIKRLYSITENQIFSTPYIVNRALSSLHTWSDAVVDPFILIDIGGATTDIHYSTDLVADNMVLQTGYDRLVFKKLGVYKSRESLIFSARENEFVYELLNYLGVTENILDEQSAHATKILMQLAIFLVLYKMSAQHTAYVTLRLERLKSIVFTGGIVKVLNEEEIGTILRFVYKKLFGVDQTPLIVVDSRYEIWTLQDHFIPKERRRDVG
jgi:hypothetical protein